VNFAITPPSESEIWTRVGELISVEVRYRSEMVKRGIFQRLGQGRSAVMAGMMILSLVGRFVGLSWQRVGAIGLLFLIAFIGVVLYTYKSWKAEDQEKFDTELTRIREQLLVEIRKVAGEAQREKQSRLGEFLEATKRAIQIRIDDVSRETQQREQAKQLELRERVRVRQRKLEQQMRDLQTLTTRLAKIRQDCASLSVEAEKDVRDTARQKKLVA
jgi:hypothetical protein